MTGYRIWQRIQAGPPYAPYSPENNGTRPEHGGGDGGGGGGGGGM